MQNAFGKFIKLRQLPLNSPKGDQIVLIETMVTRLNEIIQTLLEQKQQFELQMERQIAELHSQYTNIIDEKQSLIGQLQNKIKCVDDQNNQIQHQLKQQISEKDQSIQLLKNILKKKIIDEVVEERYTRKPTIEKYNYQPKQFSRLLRQNSFTEWDQNDCIETSREASQSNIARISSQETTTSTQGSGLYSSQQIRLKHHRISSPSTPYRISRS